MLLSSMHYTFLISRARASFLHSGVLLNNKTCAPAPTRVGGRLRVKREALHIRDLHDAQVQKRTLHTIRRRLCSVIEAQAQNITRRLGVRHRHHAIANANCNPQSPAAASQRVEGT